MGSEFPDVVPESKDSSAADDDVNVNILLPAFTPVSSKGKCLEGAHSEQRTTDRTSKRRRTDTEPPGNEDDSQDTPISPSPPERSGTRKRTRRGSPVSSSLPVTPAHGSKAASMKRKAPGSPANEPTIRPSSPDVPLASLPNVEKGRGRKSSIRENIKARQTRRLASPRSENEAENEESEHPGDDDDNSSGSRDEAEVSQAEPDASEDEDKVPRLPNLVTMNRLLHPNMTTTLTKIMYSKRVKSLARARSMVLASSASVAHTRRFRPRSPAGKGLEYARSKKPLPLRANPCRDQRLHPVPMFSAGMSCEYSLLGTTTTRSISVELLHARKGTNTRSRSTMAKRAAFPSPNCVRRLSLSLEIALKS